MRRASAQSEPRVCEAMASADVMLVDGTFWTDDEMIRLGLSKKTGADMGHLPQSGPGGMIEVLDSTTRRRRAQGADPHQQHATRSSTRTGPERRDADRARHRGGVRRHGDRTVSMHGDPSMTRDDAKPAWTRAEFEAQLRAQGRAYHIHHPFNVMLNSGGCSREQIRGWVANRFYYQINIPLKDARDPLELPGSRDAPPLGAAHPRSRRLRRRSRRHRSMGAARRCGRPVARGAVVLEHVLPGVRFAVDAYVNFARRAPWQEAVCSSLTEMFAPQIHKERLADWPEHYPWIEPAGLQYFRSRMTLAQRDVEHGLDVTLDHFTHRAQQERALEILQFKLDILWTMLDAIEKAFPQ